NGGYICGYCVQIGQACTMDADCCDNSICLNGLCAQNPNDCIPLLGPCQEDEDCCAGNCDPGQHICLGPS
ncbi:MAG: hypothetical protein JRI68_24065, partial [Deltaproteobacteria bacterium]|nr:hypothetical protein [Deltaproteobacteria bacterium]